MPQPALTVFLIIAAIAIVVVLIAVIVIALRAQRRRKLAQTLEKRRNDEVQYAFIVNPSKPQAEARRLHIQRPRGSIASASTTPSLTRTAGSARLRRWRTAPTW